MCLWRVESSISLGIKERGFEVTTPVDGFSHILVDQSLDFGWVSLLFEYTGYNKKKENEKITRVSVGWETVVKVKVGLWGGESHLRNRWIVGGVYLSTKKSEVNTGKFNWMLYQYALKSWTETCYLLQQIQWELGATSPGEDIKRGDRCCEGLKARTGGSTSLTHTIWIGGRNTYGEGSECRAVIL